MAFSKTLYPTILHAVSWTNTFNDGLLHSDLPPTPNLNPTLYPGREMGMKYLIPTCKDTKQKESPGGIWLQPASEPHVPIPLSLWLSVCWFRTFLLPSPLNFLPLLTLGIILQKSKIIKYLSFYYCFISISQFIHVWNFFSGLNNTPLYVYTTFSLVIYPLMETWVSPTFSQVNNTAVSVGVQISMWVHPINSFWSTLRSGTAGSMAILCFIFWETPILFSTESAPFYIPTSYPQELLFFHILTNMYYFLHDLPFIITLLSCLIVC